jgi:hypothetical protein
VDALALVVATQGQLRDHVLRLEEDAKEDRANIEMLKADKLRREGAIGLAEWVSRHWPVAAIAALLAAIVAWANGRFG